MLPLTMMVSPKNSGFQIGRDVGVRDVRPGDVVEERPRVGIEQRPVRVEGAVLDRQRDLVVGRPRRVAVPGCRTWKDGRRPSAGVDHLVAGSAPDDEEACWSGIHVQASHAERVVVIPGRARALAVRVLAHGRPPLPRARSWRADALPGCLAGKEAVPRPFTCVPRGHIGGIGQVPRLGVAIALVAYRNGAVHVRDERYGPGVGPGVSLEGRAPVAPVDSTRRVGPVQRRVDGQQVRQVVAVCVHELVDPLDAHGRSRLRLDGQ